MKNTHQLGNTSKGRDIAKELREMAGLTQFDVAEKAGISDSKLSLYESGFVDLADAELRQLTKALNVLVKKADFVPLPTLTSLISGTSDDTFDERYASWSEKKRIKSRRSRRRQAKLTQIELAREIGIPRKKLIHWEAGRLELSEAEFAKWQQVLTAAIVKRKQADPWTRLEVRIQIALEDALEAHEGKILDHPLIAEIMESFRREVEGLEQQRAKPTDESYKLRELVERVKAAPGQELDAILAGLTEDQEQAVIAELEAQNAALKTRAAALKTRAAALETRAAELRSKIEGD